MISVLTLTYKRHHLLEEAIESFLRQGIVDAEMIIINDNAEVDYVYDNPSIKIFNVKERFSSISAKLKWGFKQCTYNYIYRLDDDDLLAPWALQNVHEDINNHPNYEMYRSKAMYFFINNVFQNINSNINNGNVYTKAYIERITFPDISMGEDADITFHNGGSIYESSLKNTMIYRWGMGTLHISGMGIQPNEVILAQADKVLDNTKGVIHLNPHFDHDYYSQLPE